MELLKSIIHWEVFFLQIIFCWYILHGQKTNKKLAYIRVRARLCKHVFLLSCMWLATIQNYSLLPWECNNGFTLHCRRDKNISHCCQQSTHVCLQVKCPIFLSDFDQIWSFWKDLRKIYLYQISRTFLLWEPRWYTGTSRHADGYVEAQRGLRTT